MNSLRFKKNGRINGNDGYYYDEYDTEWMKSYDTDDDDDIYEDNNGDLEFYDEYGRNDLFKKTGIKVDVWICHWDGQQLEFIADNKTNKIIECRCGGRQTLKQVIPKSGHTSYGGRVFLGEWKKNHNYMGMGYKYNAYGCYSNPVWGIRIAQGWACEHGCNR